jgi:lipopolysaccharide/colanic/teichoic acid biosynthesis glycosyltransferase
MVPDAATVGPPLTIGDDPRITRIGRTLRRYKLDELPQLINVLVGEMSLVGPRPEAPELMALYTEKQREVLQLVPGITDPASVKYVREGSLLGRVRDPASYYLEVVVPEKVRLNLQYAERATFWSDLGVIANTLIRAAWAPATS